MKRRVLARDPLHEPGDCRIRLQGAYGVEFPRQRALREGRMNGAVTDFVKQYGIAAFATLQFGNEMVPALSGVRRNGPVA